MNNNIGNADRIIRTSFGALAGILALFGLFYAEIPTVIAPILGLVSLMLLSTAYMKFCGLYKIFGYDTCEY